MTDPAPLDGYAPRCNCPDLPPLTDGQTIIPAGRTAQCLTCGTTWKSKRRRDPGGETQPYWDNAEPPPADWTPPTAPTAQP